MQTPVKGTLLISIVIPSQHFHDLSFQTTSRSHSASFPGWIEASSSGRNPGCFKETSRYRRATDREWRHEQRSGHSVFI